MRNVLHALPCIYEMFISNLNVGSFDFGITDYCLSNRVLCAAFNIVIVLQSFYTSRAYCYSLV